MYVKNIYLPLLISIITLNFSFAQQNVGIGTLNPDASALLELSSSDKGLLIPRMSSSERSAIPNPARGLLVYDTTNDEFWYFDGQVWSQFSGSSSGGVTGATGPTGPSGLSGTSITIDSIFAEVAYFNTLYAESAYFDSVFSSYANFDTLLVGGKDIYEIIDSLIQAAGVQGPTGPTGANGSDGATGPTGASGTGGSADPHTLQKAYDGDNEVETSSSTPIIFRDASTTTSAPSVDILSVQATKTNSWAINGYNYGQYGGAGYFKTTHTGNQKPTLEAESYSNYSGGDAFLATHYGTGYPIRAQTDGGTTTTFLTNSYNGNNVSVLWAKYDGTGTSGNVAVFGEADLSGSGNGTGGSFEGGWIGVKGVSSSYYAGYFDGTVYVKGTLAKSSGSFRIDHPADPANQYLIHSFVESPDMMNIYNGNIVTDANGVAEVALPDYFSVLNKDFKYSLTVIGEFAQAIVSREIEGDKFEIKTDKPNIKVSWQVTGVRNDPVADKERIVPVVEKTGKEKGKYIHPELYGQPEEMGIFYEENKVPREYKEYTGKQAK